MSLDPAVAAVRLAVRHTLAAAHPGPAASPAPVLVACSGGADSLALLAATLFEARKVPRPVVGVCVDHGLQPGSAELADRVVRQMAVLGADESVTVRADVSATGIGPEAAAREARYALLEEVAERVGTDLVLLGHTLDDQAETVLLGLARGSGARSVAGMRRERPPFARPLLDLTRAQTRAACRAEGIDVWEDPHNQDPRFTRSRVRHRVLPVLEAELGSGVAAALARTADQLREDLEALDELAGQLLAEASTPDGLLVDVLAASPAALRRRALRLTALGAGAPASELFRVHVLAVEALVVDWRGQREIQLPGHLSAVRAGGTLRIARRPVGG